MSYKRFVVTDMDDTMIEAYGKPTDVVKKRWNELSKDPETCLVVATGQQYMKVKSTFLGYGLALPSYIIADQGTVIYSNLENKILATFSLPSAEVSLIFDKFFDMGGDLKFVRIYTPNMVFAFDCDIAREFFASTNQKNVIYGINLEHIIRNGVYTKVILMNTSDIVDNLVHYSMNSNTLLAVNTGATKYGNCNYHRFEIVSSNKKVALEYLLKESCKFPENPEPIEILCLGDEKSDFGLAQVALGINLYPKNSGHFAIITTNTKGNDQLRNDAEELAKAIGYSNNAFSVGSVKEDGWDSAISHWLDN